MGPWLLAIAFAFSPVTKADESKWFTTELCEAHLADTTPFESEVRDRAIELFQWLTMQHPAIRHLVDTIKFLEDGLNLSFLTSGYLIPPERSLMRRLFLINGLLRYYFCNSTSFTDKQGKSVGSVALRELERRYEDASYGSLVGEPPSDFVAQLLDRSFSGLVEMAKGGNKVFQRTEFGLHFDPVESGFHQIVRFKLDTLLEYEDQTSLKRLTKYLDDTHVRRALVHLTSQRLGSIIGFHRKLQADAKGVGNADGFRILFRKSLAEFSDPRPEPERLVGPPRPSRRPRGMPGISMASLEKAVREIPPDAFEPRSAAPEFEPSRDFLGRVHEADSIEDLRIRDLHRDLRSASALLAENLRRFARARALRARVRPPPMDLELDEEAVHRLEAESRILADALDSHLGDLNGLAADLHESKAWLERVNALLMSLNLHKAEDALLVLSEQDRILTTSILSLVPVLLTIHSNSDDAIELDLRKTARQIDAAATLGALVAHHLEEQLHGDATESLRRLGDAVKAVADVP